MSDRFARRPAEIRGNKFIGTYFEVTDPVDLMYGEPATSRTCDHCFFRHPYGHPKDPDCMVGDRSPKISFGIPLDEVMPEQIDGVEVGYYCRAWVCDTSE